MYKLSILCLANVRIRIIKDKMAILMVILSNNMKNIIPPNNHVHQV